MKDSNEKLFHMYINLNRKSLPFQNGNCANLKRTLQEKISLMFRFLNLKLSVTLCFQLICMNFSDLIWFLKYNHLLSKLCIDLITGPVIILKEANNVSFIIYLPKNQFCLRNNAFSIKIKCHIYNFTRKFLLTIQSFYLFIQQKNPMQIAS